MRVTYRTPANPESLAWFTPIGAFGAAGGTVISSLNTHGLRTWIAFGNPVSPTPDKRDHHASIVISMAGGMAEIEYSKGEDVRKWNELAGTRTDQSHIKDYRRKLGENARKPEEYESECRELVARHWALIEAVANRLLKEETVGGTEILELCERIARNVVRRQHLKK